MALKLKYKDEHGVLHINMSPSTTPGPPVEPTDTNDISEISDPQFDTINHRFGQYDLFGGKYEVEGSEKRSLFRSRYNSIEEELANTPYAFATRLDKLDAKSDARDIDVSPSVDIEDDRFFQRTDDLFGPQVDAPAFTVTQLIHAQDRYYDLSSRQGSVDSPKVKQDHSYDLSSHQGSVNSPKVKQDRYYDLSSRQGSADSPKVKEVSVRIATEDAFKILPPETAVKAVQVEPPVTLPVVPISKRKRESSFAIISETPTASRPTSPRSLPVEIRSGRRSPFKGHGFREETSRHNTPKTSAANSRASSPPRRRTNSLSKIENMAQVALPLPIHTLSRPHSPRNFLRENIEEVRELSELNREKHDAEAERRRIEDEEALLKEMGLLDKNAKSDSVRSLVGSRATSRSNSPNKLKLRSRSSSPSAILYYENISASSKEFVNVDDGMPMPVTHRSRVRNVSKSQPQSSEGSPKHSKIPKRQNSVSPARAGNRRNGSMTRRPIENGLKNQRFISNSTSSIHETIKIGSQAHDRRNLSKSTQLLSISPAHIKGKPPISPGRSGPPPSNKTINAKRLSPIVGTPNKSPVEDLKPKSAKTPTKPSPAAKKPIKTAGNTPAISRLNSRQPSRTVSRDPSPEKRKTNIKAPLSSKQTNNQNKSVARTPTAKNTPKTATPSKTEPKKPPINRTSSMKSLVRTPSTKTLNEKPPLVRKSSKKDVTEKAKSTTKINEVGTRKESAKEEKKPQIVEKQNVPKKETSAKQKKTLLEAKTSTDSGTDAEEINKQDNETQYDKITNEKGELVILTKKNIVSMTTAAITSQPLEVVTTVTNQLPVALEKAREKGIFERLSSRESLAPKDEDKEKESVLKKDMDNKQETKVEVEEKKKTEDEDKNKMKPDDKKHSAKPKETGSVFAEDNMRFKPLQPPYNNPQVERVKQKIDDILKSPEVSTENILATGVKAKEPKSTFKSVADKTKSEAAEAKNEMSKKLNDIKDQVVKQNDSVAAEIRTEATKIVNSIITPVEEPKEVMETVKTEVKKEIEPIVMVVNENKNGRADIVEKMTETLVKGEPDLEVQCSNMSTPAEKVAPPRKKMADGSDKSSHSNGGFPQSTSTTPKPPARTRKQSKDEKATPPEDVPPPESEEQPKKPNICTRLMGKCKTKCCPCCIKAEDDDDMEKGEKGEKGSRFNWFKKKEAEEKMQEAETAAERAAGKAATIEFEDETKRKRSLRDMFCGCCGRRRRVSDVSGMPTRDVTPMSPGVVTEAGCCGKKKGIIRRDSILSDRPPPGCCSRLSTWARGMCRRHSDQSSSRRTSMFSKNKSLSPTLPPEDTRKKLDTSLVEHTSVMKGAIPVLPIVLAYFCLFCNVLVPGLGTIFSGMFCLCFGIPRFGVHDGAKHRIGSLVINLIVGCGQLFTVLFCLVGWGWSIWWGVIMLKISRKYRKLKAEAAAEEAEAAPPVTANNHTRA